MWLCWVFIAACRLSLAVASGGYPLVAVHRLLTALVSRVAKALGERVSVEEALGL